MNPLLVAMILLAADGGGPTLSGSVAAGGGYDAALLVAPGEGAAGSALATAAATLGVAADAGDAVRLYGGVALDGAAFPSLPELGRTSAGAEVSCFVDVAGPLALVGGASGAWNWYVDPARSGASASVRASLVLRAARWLFARAGYAQAWRTSADPVYATRLDRLLAELEFRPWSATWISVGAFGERGDATFYADTGAVGPDAAAAATYFPYRAPATTVGGYLAIEQPLGGGFAIEIDATLRRTTSPDGVTTGPAVTLGLVWRID